MKFLVVYDSSFGNTDKDRGGPLVGGEVERAAGWAGDMVSKLKAG